MWEVGSIVAAVPREEPVRLHQRMAANHEVRDQMLPRAQRSVTPLAINKAERWAGAHCQTDARPSRREPFADTPRA
ncbi:MAG: hypothetical protein HW416_3863 [Chloroflexi bacterium]|nr:hypothetical protein [Chloroflexota bacterium]